MNESQSKQILKYIEEFGSITPIQALRDIGCYRLSARIEDLRDQGYNIITESETQLNRYGKRVSFARYKFA